MDVIRFKCPFLGCLEHFGSTNGVRHHWTAIHNDHAVPQMTAASLRAVYVCDDKNNFHPIEAVHDTMHVPESHAVTDSELIAMMGLDENSASIIDVNSSGKFGRTCRFASYPCVQIQVPNDNNWTSACSAFISQCTQRIQSISVHEQLVLSDSDKSFVPVRNAAGHYTYVLVPCSLLFNDTARRVDIASLVQFLDCSFPSRRVASVESVQNVLLECLTDQSPAQKTQSKFLSWMIWLYQGKTEYTCPDRCKNTVVSYCTR
jgi:hypothetical protein